MERWWKGLTAAREASLTPIKLNCVLMRGVNDDEIEAFARLTLTAPLHVRFIELMPLGEAGVWQAAKFFSAAEARSRCEGIAPLEPVEGNSESGPAKVFRFRGAEGTLGFITPLSGKFCDSCNRLRLTAEGWLRPCLDWRDGVDLKPVLRRAGDDVDLEVAVEEVIARKRPGHEMAERMAALSRSSDQAETMCSIGG